MNDVIAALHEAAAHAHEDRGRATTADAWARHLTAHPPTDQRDTARISAFCASLRGYAESAAEGAHSGKAPAGYPPS